jgi:uncharacterized protein
LNGAALWQARAWSAGTARADDNAPMNEVDPARSERAQLDNHAVATLQRLLDGVPEPLEPLDVSALDGLLCGVLLQPAVLPPSQWLRFATDTEGRPLPPEFDAAELQALVLRRHAELERAIAARQWFDPWVFELDDDASPSESVSPWVAGFALATEQFPALLRDHEAVALSEPLALLFRHLEPEDLEDADELLAEIETLEPPLDMAEAVEDLVRATLLLADISRPLKKPGAPRRPASRRGPRAGGAAARTAGKRRRLAGPQAKGLTASARSEPRAAHCDALEAGLLGLRGPAAVGSLGKGSACAFGGCAPGPWRGAGACRPDSPAASSSALATDPAIVPQVSHRRESRFIDVGGGALPGAAPVRGRRAISLAGAPPLFHPHGKRCRVDIATDCKHRPASTAA